MTGPFRDLGMARTDWLTVEFVVGIQNAIGAGKPISPVIDQLRYATLPGLVEYGCLRWAKPSAVPTLPAAITESPVGRALLEVSSELGLRQSGPQKRPLNRIDTQPVEFYVLDGEAALDGQEWKTFEIRFDRSAQSVGFSATAAHGLQGALHEMAENAILHSCATIPVLLGYQVESETAVFCVADVGMGVLASLRSHPAYQHIELHKDAIRAALHDGVSRFGPNQGGLGFGRVFKSLAALWGHLRFRSGSGCVTLDGTGLDADVGEESFPPSLPGFQVTISCRAGSAPLAAPLV